MPNHEEIMRQAIRLSIQNIDRGGGPFAAIIARDGEIIATGVNTVAQDNDPTAHAEVNAIRAATRELQRFHLGDCVIYTTCEPCPMCLGAIYWAGLPGLYFGNSREDAALYGFSDEHIYHEIGQSRDQRQVSFNRLLNTEAIEAFKLWDQKSDKIVY
ncbi:nucleoside deaminase [Bacteroidota bacterium]